jgi:hypothetical protein
MAQTTTIDKTTFNGVNYFINLESIFISNELKSLIWLRIAADQKNAGDLLMATITSKLKEADGSYGICRNKEILNDARTIVGCGTLVGSAICAMVMPTPAGIIPALALVCESTWELALFKGAEDCISSSLGAIAEYLGKDEEFKSLELAANIAEKEKPEIFSGLLDRMCADLKQNTVNIDPPQKESKQPAQKPANEPKGETGFGDKAADKAALKAEKEEREKLEKDRIEFEKSRAEHEREKEERDKIERDRIEHEKSRAEHEKAEKEKAERERIRLEKEKADREKGNNIDGKKDVDFGPKRDIAGFFDGPQK